MTNTVSEGALKIVALDFEQRRAADRLVDAVIDDPCMAACEIIWLRAQLASKVGETCEAGVKR